MPAVPAIIMGGSAIAGHFMASKAQKSAAKAAAERSPEETALMQQQKQQGDQLFSTAMPAIQQTQKYYNTLLSGNRAARMGAVAPEAEDTAAAYKGSEGAIKRTTTGGQREQALAENARMRASSISRLVSGVRPGAAAAQGQMGLSLLSPAMQGSQNLLANETQNRQQAQTAGRGAGQRTGANFGKLIADIGGSFGGSRQPKASGPTTMGPPYA